MVDVQLRFRDQQPHQLGVDQRDERVVVAGHDERRLAQARQDAVVVDLPTLGYLADERMHAAMEWLQRTPADPEAVRHALSLATALRALPFSLDLWQAQNIWYELSPHVVGGAKALRDDFLALGSALNIRVDRTAKPQP